MAQDLDHLRSRLNENPDDVECLEALEAALLEAHDWQGLVEVTQHRVDRVDPDQVEAYWLRLVHGLEGLLEQLPDEQASALLVVTAGVAQAQLGRPEEALIRYHTAWQRDTSNLHALRLARQLCEREGNWNLVIELYQHEAQALSEPEEVAGIYLELAKVLEEKLQRPDDAFACVRRAQMIAPEHAGLAPYQGLLDQALSAQRQQVEALLQEAQQATDERRKAGLLTHAARALFEIDSRDAQIFELLREALNADPRNDDARVLYEHFLESNARWAELSEWLQLRLKATTRKSERQSILQQLAQVAQVALEDQEQALEWHRQVLQLSATEADSLNFCVDYYSSREQWAELVAVYEAALRVRTAGGSDAAMLVQIAMILWRKLNNLSGAENYFKRIKLNDPKNALMLQFYTEYFAEKGDYRRLLNTLAVRQGVEQTDAGRIEVGLQMAEVAETQLKNPEKAIDVWKSILKIDPAHAEAREALLRLFTATRKYNALLEFLKEEEERLPADDVAGRVALLEQVVVVYRDSLRQPLMVVNTYHAILALDPTNGAALDALQEIYEQGGRWNDLVNILERRIELSQKSAEPEALVALHRQVGELFLGRFSNATQASVHFETILEYAPQDAQALARLIEIQRQRKDYSALFALYEREVPTLTGEARLERLKEMAQIAGERLSEPGKAIDLWQTVRVAQPEADEAWQALEALYQQTAAWPQLAELLRARAEATAEPAQQAQWLRKLAELTADLLDDEEQAAQIWLEVLDRQPADAAAEGYLRQLYLEREDFDALTALYARRAQWGALIELFERRIAEGDDVAQRVALWRRIAQIRDQELSDVEGAVAAWEQVLALVPDHGEAAQVLAPYYHQTEQWAPLVAMLQIALDQGLGERIPLMADLAQVYETQLNDLPEAWRWYAQALQEAPQEEILVQHTLRVATALGRYADLADLLEDLVPTVEGPTALAMRELLAQLWAQALGEPQRAIEHLVALREAQGDRPELLDALQVLYTEVEDVEALLEVYEASLRGTDPEDQPAQIQQLMRIAQLHEGPRADAAQAQASYERVLALDANNLEAIQGLQRLAEAAGDLALLAELVEREQGCVSTPEERAHLQLRRGLIASRQGDVEEAIAHYAQVLQIVPRHTQAMSALAALLESSHGERAAAVLEPHVREAEAWPKLRQILRLQAAAAQEMPARRALLSELAQLEAEAFEDDPAAFEAWRAVLDCDPMDATARRQLEALAERLDTWDDLCALYERFALNGDLSLESEPAIAYSRRVATIAEDRLADWGRARGALEAIAAELPTDEPTLEALDRLLTQQQDWPALVALCEQRLSLSEVPAQRFELLQRIGQLWEAILDDPDAAIDAWRRAREIDPQSARAVEALERLFVAQGRGLDLAQLLEARLTESEDAAQKVELHCRLAEVLRDDLQDHEGALAQLEAALALSAEHSASREALETYARDAEQETLWRARAVEILAPKYRETGDEHAWVSLQRLHLTLVSEPEAQTAIRLQIVEVLNDTLGDPQQAFETCLEGLREAPGQRPLQVEAERLAEQLGAFEQLAELLDEALQSDAGLALEPEARIALHHRAAQICATQLAQPARAIERYRRLLEEAPEDAEALAQLDALLVAAGEPEALVPVLSQRLELAADDEARAALAFRLGALYEHEMQQPEEAVEVYERIRREWAVGEPRSYEALERLYVQLGAYDRLVEALEEQLPLAQPSAQRGLRLRIASLYEEQLDSAETAVEVYAQQLEEAPEDLEVLAALDALYTRLDRSAELREVLERRRELTTDAAQAQALALRLGQLLSQTLLEPAQAVTVYEALLSEDPQDEAASEALRTLFFEVPEVRAEAARVLEPLYVASAQPEKLRALLRGLIEVTEAPTAHVALLQRIAQIEETQLEDHAAAFETLGQALRVAEGDAEIQQPLERLAAQLGAEGALADLYEEVIPLAPERGHALWHRIAELSEYALDAPQRAVEALEAALSLEPDDVPALHALERLFIAQDQPESLAEVLTQQAQLAEDDAARVPLWRRIAELSTGTLDRPEVAIDLWQQVLGALPEDAQAQEALETLYGQAEDWPALAAQLEHRIEQAQTPELKAEAQYTLAQLCAQNLREGERALELYEAVLAAAPAHEATLAALVALFEDDARCDELGVERDAVGRLLEPSYRAEKNAAGLAALLALRHTVTDEVPEKIEVLGELAELQEGALEDLDAAFDARVEILALAPELEENRKKVWALAQQTYRWGDLAETLEQAAAGAMPEDRAQLLMTLGSIQEQHLGQDAQAREVYREILLGDPAHEGAFTALVDLFTRTASWDELVALHMSCAADELDVQAKLGHYFKVCQLLEDVLGEPARAIDVYRAILELEPENDAAFEALRKWLAHFERPMELIELLRGRLEYTEADGARADLRFELGQLYFEQLEDVDAAIDAWSVAVSDDLPDHPASVRALEGLLSQLDETAYQRESVARVLEPIYTRAEAWEKLVAALEVRVTFEQDPWLRVELLQQIVELHDQKLGAPQAAFEACARALAVDMANLDLQRRLDELGLALGAHAELVAAYSEGLAHLSDMDVAVSTLFKVAGWLEDPLQAPARAVEALSQLLEIDDAHEAALEAIERLYAQLGDSAALVQVLERRAELSEDREVQRALRVRAAALYTDALDDLDSAIDQWRRIYEEDSDDSEALDALIDLYARSEQWSQVVVTLRERLDLSPEGIGRKQWYARIASIYEEQLEDTEETIHSWRSILDLDERDADALAALDRLYSHEERWGELIDLLSSERDALRSAEGAEAALQASTLDLRIAGVLETQLENVSQAIEVYAELLEVPELRAEALAALERLLADAQWRLPAAQVLEAYYEREGLHERLAHAYELQLEELFEPYERVALLKRLAALYDEPLQQPQRAFEIYARTFEEASGDSDVVAALSRLADGLGAQAQFAQLLSQQAAESLDALVAIDLYRRLARLYEQLGAPAQACEAWEAVVEREAFDEEALAALDRLYQQLQAWPRLIEILKRRVDLVAPEELSDLRFRLGYIIEATEQDIEAALQQYQAVLIDDPQHGLSLEALERLAVNLEYRQVISEALEPIYRDAEAWTKLAILSEMGVELAQDAYGRAQLWAQAARLYEEALNEPALALDRQLRAFDELPEDIDVREHLFELGEGQGRYGLLVDALERAASRVGDPELRLEDHLRAAPWCQEKLDDLQRAIAHYQAALEIAPDAGPALEALEKIYRGREDWPALAAVLQRKSHATFELDVKRALLLELGQLAHERLDDNALAVEAFTEAIEIDDSSLEPLQALQQIHTQQEDWPALLRILEHKIGLIYDGEALTRLHQQIAELARDRLDDAALAAEHFERALTLQPGDAALLEALRALYAQMEDWDALQGVLVKALAEAPAGAQREALLVALADNAQHHLQRPDEAIEYLYPLFNERPTDEAVTDRLAELYLASGRAFDLVETLRAHLKAGEGQLDEARAVRLRVRIAEVAEAELGDADLAIETLNGVLALNPDHAYALAVLARLYERSGEWEKAAQTLQRSIEKAQDKQEKLAALSQLGQLAAGPLDQRELAQSSLKIALALEPSGLSELEPLIELAARVEDGEAQIELLARKVAFVAPEKKRAALLELAKLRAAAGDESGRLADLEAAYALDQSDLAVNEQLIDAYLAAGEPAKAQPLLAAAIETLESARRFKELLGYRYKLGQLAEAAGDEAGALAAYQACYAQDATYVPNLIALGKLHVRGERPAEALKVLQTALLHQSRLDGPGKVDLFYHLGKVRQALGEDRKARDMFNRALALDPDFAPARAALEG